MLFDALVAGYVRSNGARALATVFAIALGIAIALGSTIAQREIRDALAHDVANLDDGVALRVAGNGRALDERAIVGLEDVEGVAEVRPIVEGSAFLSVPARAGELLRIEGVDLSRALPGVANAGEAVAGPFAPQGDIELRKAIGAHGIVLGDGLAQRLHLRRGDAAKLRAPGREFAVRVAAVLPARVTGIDALTAFTDLSTAQLLFAATGTLDRADIVVDAPLETVRARIAAVLPPGALVEAPQRRAGALADLALTLANDMNVLGLLALLAGALLCADTVATSVARRRSEIGTLRALGVTRAAIARTFVIEGAGYGLCGALFGMLLGIFASSGIVGALAGAAQPNDPLAFGDDPALIFGAVFAGMLVAAASAVPAAMRAASIAPALTASASGFVAPAHPRTLRAFLVSSLAAVVVAAFAANLRNTRLCEAALVAVAIASMPLATRTLARVLGARARVAPAASTRLSALVLRAASMRAGFAAATLALGLGGAVALMISASSLQSAVHTWVADAYPGDLLVRTLGAESRGGFTAENIVRATAVPGVAAVRTERARTIAYDTGTLEVVGRGDSREPLAPRVALTPAPATISMRFAQTHALKPGSAMMLATPFGPLALRVEAVRSQYARAGDVVAVDLPTYRRAFNDPRVDTLAITVARGTDVEAVRRRVVAALHPQALDVRITAQERAAATSVFDRTLALAFAVGALAIVLSLTGVGGALGAFIFERRRELGLMRVAGATRGVMRTLVVSQGAIIGSLGALGGLVLGVALAAVQTAIADPSAPGEPAGLVIPVPFILAMAAATALAATGISFRSAGAAAAIPLDGIRRERG